MVNDKVGYNVFSENRSGCVKYVSSQNEKALCVGRSSKGLENCFVINAQRKVMYGGIGMQNRIFQNTCNQLKKDIHRKIGIMDDNGYIIASSDESKVGHQNEAVIAHFEINNEEYVGGGYVFRKIETCNKNVYVVFCEGTDELAKGYAAFLGTHFSTIKQYYDEKYDRNSFIVYFKL